MCRREGDKGQTTGVVVNREKIQYKIVGGKKMNFEKRFCFDWEEMCSKVRALPWGTNKNYKTM